MSIFGFFRSLVLTFAFWGSSLLGVSLVDTGPASFFRVQGSYFASLISPTEFELHYLGLFENVLYSGSGFDVQRFDLTLFNLNGSAVAGLNIRSQYSSAGGGTVGVVATRFPDGVYSFVGSPDGSSVGFAGAVIFSGETGRDYEIEIKASFTSALPVFDSGMDSKRFRVTFGRQPPIPSAANVGPPRGIQLGNLISDPVNLTTGEFYGHYVDMAIGGAAGIKFERAYTSRNSVANELGYGWTFNYLSYLVRSSDLSSISACLSDGSVIAYSKQSGVDVWLPFSTLNAELVNSAGSSNYYNSRIVGSVDGLGRTVYSWELPDGGVRRYVVRDFPVDSVSDARPYLAAWVDNRGNSLSFEYGDSPFASNYARITQIRSTSGGVLNFDYNVFSLIASVWSPDGRRVSYAYSDSGDLEEVTLLDGQKIKYEYGYDLTGASTHKIIREIKPSGRILENVYDDDGRVVQQKATVDSSDLNALVVNATFDYSVVGKTSVSDAYGNATTYSYTDHQVTEIEDPLGRKTLQSWYSATDPLTGAYERSLASKTDARGLVTTYKYDAAGNIVETKTSGDHLGDGTNQDVAVTAEYNVRNLPVEIVDSAGVVTQFDYENGDYPYLPTEIRRMKDETVVRVDRFEYDDFTDGTLFAKGLLTKKTSAYGTDDEAVVEYGYNSSGLLVTETKKTGTADPDVVTTFGYNNRFELISQTDAEGRSKTFTYDAKSRLLSVTTKNENEVTLGVQSSTYNAAGEVESLVGYRTGPSDSVSRFYDGAGRVLREEVARSKSRQDASGVESDDTAVTHFAHDYFGNLTSVTDPRGNVALMNYDEAGQLTSKEVAGLRTESFEYEAGGQISIYTDPLGGLTKKFYTDTGKLRRQENPDGSVLEWRYYVDGRLAREILRDGSFWLTDYDDVARSVTRSLFKLDEITVLAEETRTYDRRGNVISHTDQADYTRVFVYDDLDRLKSSTGPVATSSTAQQVQSYVYGATSRLVVTSNPLGESTETELDALGRLVRKEIKDFLGQRVYISTNEYASDNQSVVTTVGSGDHAISQTVFTDLSGRALISIAGDGGRERRSYDLGGNLVSVTDALGRTTSHSYDALNRVSLTQLVDGNETSFNYDAAGNLLERVMPGGFTAKTVFDSAGRVESSLLKNGEDESREYAYTYYPLGHVWAGLRKTTVDPRGIVSTFTYDDRLRLHEIVTDGTAAETDSTTTYGYDERGAITSIAQSSPSDAAGPATLTSRTYDGYGQLLSETVSVSGTVHSSQLLKWDAAGRRLSLHEALATLPAPLFAYEHRADGRLSRVTASGSPSSQNFDFSYSDAGLLESRTNPFRTLEINDRDAAGRILQQTITVASEVVMTEQQAWRADSTLESYAVTRADGWNENRRYVYDQRGRVVSEGVSPEPQKSIALNYEFDHGQVGLGIRTAARMGSGAPLSWESSVSQLNSLARVTEDVETPVGQFIEASGVALGADHVAISVDGTPLGRADHPGWADETGAWKLGLNLRPGEHTLRAEAVHPSGHYTASAENTFTVSGTDSGPVSVESDYDAEGNVISRTFSDGRVQLLTWDAFNRLIKISQRNLAQDGYDWSAVYDSGSRRLKTLQQSVESDVAVGPVQSISSFYDPLIEFLEVGVAVDGQKTWKIYGPDLTGLYGGLQGTGGFEAVILDVDGTCKGAISDSRGNGLAAISGGHVIWSLARIGGYGPLPNIHSEVLSNVEGVVEASVWRGQRIDPSGFYYLGARYYEPGCGRFLSCDPMGHVASLGLYDFSYGDPVNYFDADGRLAKGARDLVFGGGNAAVTDAAWAADVSNNVGLSLVRGATGILGMAEALVLTQGASLSIDSGWTRTTQELALYKSPMEQAGYYENNQFTYTLQETVTAATELYLLMKPSPTTTSVSAAESATPLYRAVMPGELASIQSTKALTNPLGVEVKYFSTSAEGAASYARQAAKAFGDGPFTIIKTEMPTSLITPEMRVVVDRGVQSIVVPTETLPSLARPIVLPATPVPPAPGILIGPR